jgi:hypothetical protein
VQAIGNWSIVEKLTDNGSLSTGRMKVGKRNGGAGSRMVEIGILVLNQSRWACDCGLVRWGWPLLGLVSVLGCRQGSARGRMGSRTRAKDHSEEGTEDGQKYLARLGALALSNTDNRSDAALQRCSADRIELE